MLILLLFPIGTILSSVPGGLVFNKVLYAFLILVLFIKYMHIKFTNRNTIIFALLIIVYFYGIVITDWPLINSNEIFYLGTWVLYLIYVTNDYEKIFKMICSYTNMIQRWVIIWEIIVGASLFFPTSYENGGFGAFTGSPHRMDSAALLILAYIFVLYRIKNYKKTYLFLIILPVVAVILSGARTYLLATGALLLIIYYYAIGKRKKIFYFTVIPLVIAGVLFILNTSIMQERMEKIAKISNYFDSQGYNKLAAVTSGRSVFWIIDLQQYWESSFLNKILGNGWNFVRKVNGSFYTTSICAHNDFINLLCCNGVLGLALYFVTYISFYKKAKKASFDRKSSFILGCGFHFTCMFIAIFNMLYTYFAAVLAVPILAFAIFDNSLLPRRRY